MLPSVQQLCESPGSFLGKVDIAALNLVCAGGLPGSEELDIGTSLGRLDDWVEIVRVATEKNYGQFINSPQLFRGSQAYYCALSMVTALQRQCGVRYNPRWLSLRPGMDIPPEFPRDSLNIFIHAITAGIGGTCGSLPVVYVSVGRRLGYPLKLVKASRHLFVRWDDPQGRLWLKPETFNLEASCQGLHTPPDEEYRTWPHPIEQADLDSSVYLSPLTAEEECAEFLATRGHCLLANDRLQEAVKIFGGAARLAPKNRHFAAIHAQLQQQLIIRRRAALPGPIGFRSFYDPSPEPRWLQVRGKRVLVQVPRPWVSAPLTSRLGIGCGLQREHTQTPSGASVEVDVPSQCSIQPMRAEWIRLQCCGRYALVHIPVARPIGAPLDHVQNGRPCLPEPFHGWHMHPASAPPRDSALLPCDSMEISMQLDAIEREEASSSPGLEHALSRHLLPSAVAPRPPGRFIEMGR